MGKKEERAVNDWLIAHHMIPDQLDKRAKIIRDYYQYYRRTLFPNYTINRTRHNALFWRRVAICVIDNDLDYKAFVQAVFGEYGPKAYPETLIGRNVVRIYKQRVNDAERRDSILLHLELYVDKIKTRRAYSKEPLTTTLTDTRNCFIPLFVWCMAEANNLPELAAQYEERAMITLANPLYREVYSKAFPKVVQHVSN